MKPLRIHFVKNNKSWNFFVKKKSCKQSKHSQKHASKKACIENLPIECDISKESSKLKQKHASKKTNKYQHLLVTLK